MSAQLPAPWLRLLGTAGIVLALAPAAQATPLTATQIFSTFNLVTTGNVTAGQDIEGSAIIGGNLGGSGTFFNNNVPTSPVVYLYGQQSGNSNLDGGGSLYHSGSFAGTVNYNGGGALVASGPPRPVTDYTTPLTQLSITLAGLAPNSAVTVASNTLTFNAVAGSDGTAVIGLTGAQLTADMRSVIAFSLGVGVTSVVVDVFAYGDAAFSEPNGVNWNGPALRDVLFNFVGFTNVTVGNWQSSILAPGANVAIGNGALNGSVFAGSFSGGGELHNYAYAGTLPDPGVPVSEPATLGLLAVGTAALAHAARRRPRTALAHT